MSVDGGASWHDAELGEQAGARAWRGWSYAWDSPAPGSHVICSRATDAAGNVQPVEPPWNLKGFANNEVERLASRSGRDRDARIVAENRVAEV